MENKNFYSITKGQLVITLIFGVIGALFSFISASEERDPFFGLLGIDILFFIFFYTIGWRANKKKDNQL